MNLSTAQKSDNINFQFPISKLVHTKRSKRHEVHPYGFLLVIRIYFVSLVRMYPYGWISNCERLQKNYLE